MYKFLLTLSMVFLLFILWVIYMANTNINSIFFEIIKSIPYGDKVGHVLLFGFLTLAANYSFKFSTLYIANIKVYWGTVLVSIFALIEEISQLFIAARTFDSLDLAANLIGISLFTLISSLRKTERNIFR